MNSGSNLGNHLLGEASLLDNSLLDGNLPVDQGYQGLGDLLASMGSRLNRRIDVPDVSPFLSNSTPPASGNRFARLFGLTISPNLTLPNPPSSNPPESNSPDPLLGVSNTTLVGSPVFRSDVNTTPGFTLQAEGRVIINGRSDLDGDPLNPLDDALIYGGSGLRINGRPTLPVQYDDGQVRTDDQGRPLVLRNALTVGANYGIYRVPTQTYGGLDTPTIIDPLSVEIPDFDTLVTDHLADLASDISPIHFNPRHLYNARRWQQQFPGGGTAERPTVIEIQGHGLHIPNGVTLENTIIIVDRGPINFHGREHHLSNVTLITRNGGVNLNNVQADNLRVFSSGSINMNRAAQFGGDSILASGDQRSIHLNGRTRTTDANSHLTVISQRNITVNHNLDIRGRFQAGGNVTLNGRSTLTGSIAAQGTIRLNGNATVTADTIAPENQAPTDLSLDTNEIDENSPTNTTIGRFSTLDPDVNDRHTYSLVTGAGDVDNARFQIVGDQLQLLTAPDFETQSNYSIRVRSTDAAGASATKVLTIGVLDVNEAPTQILLSQTRVAETSGGGTVIGQVSTIDPDANDSHTYRLLNDADNRFRIVNGYLELAPNADLDFETEPSFVIRIESTDTSGLSHIQDFTIEVTDQNEAPTTIELSQTTVAEDTPENTVIGTVRTQDPDLGQTHTYTLLDDADGRFQLVDNQLQVAAGASFDFETQSQHDITIRSTDSAGLSSEQTLTLSVTDRNERPAAISLSHTSIPENAAAGAVIGTLSTTDPDVGDSHTYSLLNDAGGRFQIIDGQLQVAANANLDFEHQATFTIAIRSTDTDGLSLIREFEIQLTDVNEAPQSLTLDPLSLPENTDIDTAIGTLTATDPDRGDVSTFALVSGDGDRDNTAFTILGNQLYLTTTPDFETQASYQLRIRTTDQAGLSLERMFSLQITDINEAPTAIALDGNGLLENASAGTVIGTLSTLDTDLGDTHTYSLTHDAQNRFQIVGNQIQVAPGAEFDYETETRLSVTVRSTDSGGLSTEQPFTLYIMDVEEGITLTADLANDTAPNATTNNDRVTSDATITGQIGGGQAIVRLWAGFGDATADQYIDLIGQLQSDGTFTLDETTLVQVYGGAIPDGEHVLHLQAMDQSGGASEFFDVHFTLDRSNPELELTTPLADGLHSTTVQLLGSVTDQSSVESVTATLNGVGQTLPVDETGTLDTLLAETLVDGAHQLTVTVVDVAGNQTETEITFQVSEDAIVVGPQTSNGFGAFTDDQVVLGEGDSLVTEASIAVDLGQETGSRTLRFDVDAAFDRTAAGADDRLLVYLVDANDPQTTLLDHGTQGTPVFTLSESGTEFQAGLVRYDGSEVEIDVTALEAFTQGLLVFQLINQDIDTDSVISITDLTNEVDASGVASPVFPVTDNRVQPGEILDLSGLSPSETLDVIWSNVQLDAATGQYTATLQVRNTGTAIGRQVAVVFNDLPVGVSLENASGVGANNAPYLNLQTAIPRGGLAEGATSEPVSVVIDNPGLLPFDFETTVLTGGANRAPVLEPIVLPDVLPGSNFALPIQAIDPDGDIVTIAIRSEDELPTGYLSSDAALVFQPRPDQVGTYTFTVVASDGALETTQDVTLNVVADPITTTRISGVIENVDQEPLIGVVVEIGGIETTTNADGLFTLEFPGELPDDTLRVHGDRIPGDDVYPFIAERLSLVLGREVYEGVNNAIERPIYLPVLDIANGQTVNPTQTTVITTDAIPGAAVTVPAGSLEDAEGNPFNGILSITEVPADFTPAALPENIDPDLVVTIQPGEMQFTRPAALTLPNRSGFAPGVLMDLWSIDPETGDFEIVGLGRVSDDGSVIETIEGGIRSSSWHVFAWSGIFNGTPGDNPRNRRVGCGCPGQQHETPHTSSVQHHSGALIETHDLAAYRSVDQTRGITLTYDSLRVRIQVPGGLTVL